jgi:TFIIF-interacting CTD phosphatase-like protein
MPKQQMHPIHNVILDLDNTLLYSVPLANKAELKRIDDLKTYESFLLDKDYRVYLRPYVDNLLSFLFEHKYRVIIWTAADCHYGSFIVKELIKRNLNPYLVLCNRACDRSQTMYGNGTFKNLKYLAHIDKTIDLDNTIIVDDQPDVQKINGKTRVILAPAFLAKPTQTNDTFLLDVISKLEQRSGGHPKMINWHALQKLNE